MLQPSGLKTKGHTSHCRGLLRQVQLNYVLLREPCFTVKQLKMSLLFLEGHPMSIYVQTNLFKKDKFNLLKIIPEHNNIQACIFVNLSKTSKTVGQISP